MVKKILLYNILFFLAIFFTFIIVISKIINNVETKISMELYNMEFTKKLEQTQNQLLTIKDLLTNYYILLKKHSYQKKEIEILHNFKNIENLLEILNNFNIKQKNLILNQLILKNQSNIKIINLNNTIIASKNILEIGKKYALPCDPLKNYGLCKKEKNKKVFIVQYLPNYKLYLLSYFNYKIKTKNLINILKSFNHLVIIKQHHIIKNHFSSDGFYVFEYFKPINIFFGKKISYKELQKNQIFIENFNRHLKNTIVKIAIIFLVIIITVFIIFLIFFEKNLSLIDEYFNDLKQSNVKDTLTKLYNRKYLKEIISKINLKNLVIIDLDNFKYINDTFGHEVGDKVLKYFADLLKQYFPKDTIIRWGGDEFIVITNKTPNELKEIITLLNKDIKKYQKSFDNKLIKTLSVSAGICEKNLPYEEKFKNADLALYKVKKTKKGKALTFNEIDYIKIDD